MSNNLQPHGDDAAFAQPLLAPIKRRSFFMYAGATAGATALALAGCSKNADPVVTPGAVSLGTGDAGVLNYAYALEQLEAAFYAQVVKTPAGDFQAGELAYFTEVAAHEAIHRDFLRAAINRDAPGKLLQTLNPIFPAIDFTKRLNVLTAAQTFEDLGVAAYNGAGILLRTPAYLVIAGQIVSVEARHAAYIRERLLPNSFSAAPQVDAQGLDKQLSPTDVIAAAQAFFTEQLDASTVGK